MTMTQEWAVLARQALALGASDLHLSAGLPPMVRVHGVLQALNTPSPAWCNGQIQQVLQQLMTAERWNAFATRLEDDFAFAHPDWGRWRVNAFQQHRGTAIVMRAIPDSVPRLVDLQAPALLNTLALKSSGLILVTGPTGCGKSTLLAALLDHANRSLQGHLLTIEDPIEFVHRPHQCVINQREVGLHTHSFEAALRSALREDPDVILIGELRDLATIRLALTAAETGHLVLASLHTASAPQAVDRMVDVFAAEEKDLVRTLLADALLAVVAQTLCPRQDGAGRVAAHEVMVATPAVRNLIREGKTAQLYSVLQTGAQAGMQTLDQSLQALRQSGQISADTARSLARFPAL
jgi:twitching motility protein PilT